MNSYVHTYIHTSLTRGACQDSMKKAIERKMRLHNYQAQLGKMTLTHVLSGCMY